jgi:putative ABC transport system permease protein
MTKLGARSLFEHKLRSFLTALGIIFGVASVIAMLAIGEGASYEARQQIRNMGSSNIIIRSRKPESVSKNQETRHMSIYGLTYDDALRIKVLFPNVLVQVPARVISDRLRHGSESLSGRIVGTVPWYLEKTGLHVREGRFLNAEDVRKVDNVAVLTAAGVRALFPLSYPIGQTVYLGSQAYVVVGVVDENGGVGNDDGKEKKGVYDVYIPISAAKNRFGEVLVRRETGSFQMEKVELHQLTVTAPSDEAVIPLAHAIRTLLERFHKENDFEITIPLELLRQAEATKRIFNIVLGSIAAISLLVGGIGIMNIMLASVTERTREIGIRRALGATRSDIVLQFLAEALLLSVAGGVVGVAVGIAIPEMVTRVAGLTTIIRSDALGLAFSISVLTGVVFGIYPATRAATLSPIEALRHE